MKCHTERIATCQTWWHTCASPCWLFKSNVTFSSSAFWLTGLVLG